jgi:signal transduction histidine kinase/ligand-binding sensor domain-containing protein
VGTQDGLDRYDGYEFRVWRRVEGDPRSLPGNRIEALFEDAASRLWVGTAEGLCRFDRAEETCARYTLARLEGGGEPVVGAFAQTGDGAVWAGSTLGLHRYLEDADRWADVELAGAGRPARVLCLAAAEDGTLWILAADAQGAATLWRRSVAGELALWVTGALGNAAVDAFVLDASGRPWLAPAGPEERARRTAAEAARAAWRDDDGTLWFAGVSGLVERPRRGGPPLEHHIGEGALENYVEALWRDRSGILWVGTEGGLYRHDPHKKPFAQRRHEEGVAGSLSADAVSALLEDSAGRLWIGTYGAGLNRRDPGARGTRVYRHRPGDPASLPDDEVWALLEHDGRIWVLVWYQLCALEPATDRLECFPLRSPGAASPGFFAQSIAAGPDGALWLTADGGLLRVGPDGGAATLFPYHGLPGQPESAQLVELLFDPPGAFWVTAWRGPLLRFELASGTFTAVPRRSADGHEQTSSVFDLHRDGEGVLWLGTGDGLSRFEPDDGSFRHWGHADGLPGTNVYSLLGDGEGRLWLGTNQGLVVFDPRVDGPGAFRAFGASDGVVNVEFNRNARWATRDGRFLFGGLSGLTEFRPAEIHPNAYPPPVALTGIEVVGRDGERRVAPFGLRDLALTHRDAALTLEFAALSYTDPERNRYAYRLEGFDDGWVESGTRRLARYTNLPPGSYRLRVRAANNDGLWGEELALPITVTPPFWRTWWFRGMVAVALAAALWTAHRARLKRLLEVERLRLRIAGDLHDQLSSDLAGIALASDVVGQRPELPAEPRRQLEQVRDTALRSVDALRDIVWTVNPDKDTFEALETRMRLTAQSLLAGIDYRLETEPPGATALPTSLPMALPMEWRRQLFLSYKELLHNVARHARCTSARIRLELADDRLILQVEDDGVGFDPSAVAQGTGLASLRRRARELGGVFEVVSRPGGGTLARLAVPIPRGRDGTRWRGLLGSRHREA